MTVIQRLLYWVSTAVFLIPLTVAFYLWPSNDRTGDDAGA